MDSTNTKGTVLIVDISGYTKFINNIDIQNGVQIVRTLLNTIIKQDRLSLSIAEIEGDAVLFYKLGKPFPIQLLMAEFYSMFNAFKTEIDLLEKQFPALKDLSLKAVTHYGSIEQYTIGGFQKLYGKVLVDAHRLLKNSIPTDTYVMITNHYLNALTESESQYILFNGYQRCDLYDVGKLCYTYIPFPKTVYK
ncbi:DUF2652 domain-containing protein [Larkinella sp. VNQ87]|uniref:DUF2652 domain-containing protein n=1 Tax=Larkinella sp. VNQ87 TaxID=3400921 RepID=UPI003C02912A